MSDRRVVITGIGVVAPGEPGVKAFWDRLLAGRTATRAISAFDASRFRSRIAAECDFDPAREGLTPQEIRRMDRATQFAVVSAREAISDSGLEFDAEPSDRVGVTIGSAVGATIGLETEYTVVSNGGKEWVVDPTYGAPQLYGYLVPSMFAAEVAWQCAAEGPVTTVSTGCTSGLDAVGFGAGRIRDGSADIMVAGATDAPISPISVASFDAIKATTPNNSDPEHASRPFDRDRNGFVLGEGAAIFVLEEYERARRRNANWYAELTGFASRSNAFHMTGLKADGREMAEAISAALRQAGISGEQIGYINAHGSGTRQNDRHETAAFKRGLGQHAYEVPISSIKSMIGHSLGAIGAIELAACALALTDQVVPPTANLHNRDPECDLDYVPITARETSVDVVLSVGSGFGGFQSAVLLSGSGRAR